MRFDTSGKQLAIGGGRQSNSTSYYCFLPSPVKWNGTGRTGWYYALMRIRFRNLVIKQKWQLCIIIQSTGT